MRSWILSAVVAAAATGQPPATPDPKPPAKGSVEDAILNAQRNHPDIKLAEAKLRMAEAEVEQARFQVAQRVATAFGKVEQAKVVMKLTSERATVLENLRKQGGVGLASFEMTQAAKLAALNAKADLAAAELELKAATGAALRYHSPATDTGLKASVGSPPAAGGKPLPVGAVADKLKALIDKPVKLDLKAADLDEALAAVLKSAGEPTLTVKLPKLGRGYLDPLPTVTCACEMSFTATVQSILDEVNSQMDAVPATMRGKYDVYVREYGLLVARVTDAPNDAPTLTEFARQVRAENAAKK